MEGVQVSARLRFIAPALFALAAAACGDGEGGALEGSVTPLLDLRYQRAEARLAEGSLAVSFVETQGTGQDVVLKVSARVADMLPEDPEYAGSLDIDLAEPLEDGSQRGSVDRSVLDEPVRPFPLLARGNLFVKSLPKTPGDRVSGEFNVTFVNGTDVYSGRTIFGRFEATAP
ncbi:hypothetical protein D7Y13_12000 [Corallococcus praedator]|uniref:Lipoprotein n=1 Tax=Corallococcus praedator TaxID=2316724 RepID=A0ABX9QKX1_9BACT|nr:hypothetical protein D7X74_15135 [Corallococcus sp. CA047B]RKH31822.1 hypothetical protein D7X75_18050 [Corallococcus sp. CA031C]RKI10845.1 hypothetical protein D7Y13_12000 [Corallococcus praedator]